ncbi:MAG: hypothetical protein IT393_01810 [Nitrospirae bacterium]|nr:hypothetical protein [Nitrospirota bacterium]
MKTLKIGLSLLLLAIFFYTGCSPKYVSTATVPNWADAGIRKVVVIPFIAMPDGDQKGLRSARVSPDGVTMVYSTFYSRFGELGYLSIPYDEVDKDELAAPGPVSVDLVRAVGEKTGGDAILTGVVTRYEERVGGPVGIRKPASVGFEARLINAKDGTLLWTGKYAETQKSLTEDLSMILIFIQRGGKWLTAEQLARYGVNEMLKTLPKVK